MTLDEQIDEIEEPPVSTGIAALDDILRGGFTPSRLYLIEGNPGSGKTTLSLQFLLEGVRQGESTLYVTLSETKRELLAVARSHGWSLDGIYIHEMEASEDTLAPDAHLTMFHPSELELGETTKAVLSEVEKRKPKRVVFDSLSEMRLLAQNPLRYRRQILGLKQFFAGKHSTVLLLDDRTGAADDLQLQSIAHGVINLEQSVTEYGSERRWLTVRKMRGVGFRGGRHDYAIRRGGLQVFPRLVAAEHLDERINEDVATGNESLDRLLGGGLASGSSTLLIGPAGIGKSSVGIQFAVAAAERGGRAAVYLFDETVKMLRTRSRNLGMSLEGHIESGLITVQKVDPAELSPGEFACILRGAVDGVDENGRPAAVVVIDSLNGYLHSMPDEKFLSAQLHELFTYLNHRGVNTLVTVTQSGLIGTNMQTPVDTTYLADNVIIFRYFEAHGQIRRAISVLKKRSGPHERFIREMLLSDKGIELGESLKHLEGIMIGTPRFVGSAAGLLDPHEAPAGGDERDNGL